MIQLFVTRKWIEVNHLSNGQYSVNKIIRFKTSMLRSDLWDYSDTYIVVEWRISVAGTNKGHIRNNKLTFKNNEPIRSCISKTNNKFKGNAEDFDIVMLTYNLLEYSEYYPTTSGSLWNRQRDEMNDDANEINANHR